ncbi:MAG: DEAD/DEAH box helicase [Spirochaetaceae bacterium]|nr:MAG: DEAD/DEAH box helicase [Spirochaetaceae bacterium]
METAEQALSLIPAVYADNSLVLEWVPAETKAVAARTELEHRIFSLFEDKKRHKFLWLLSLGVSSQEIPLTPGFSFLRDFARLFVREARLDSAKKGAHSSPCLTRSMTESLLYERPPFPGSGRMEGSFLSSLWSELGGALREGLAAFKGTLDEYITAISPTGSHADRVHFHMVENPLDVDKPFAFLATYSATGEAGRLRHILLSSAVDELGGDKRKLLGLLAAVRRVAEKSAFIRGLLESGELFQPIGLTVKEAHVFLSEALDYEAAGILCKVPKWWNKRKSSFILGLTVGKTTTRLGADALLDLDMRILADGEQLSLEEIDRLLAQTEPMAMLKGKWVTIDHEALLRVKTQFEQAKKLVAKEGLSIKEAIRLILDQRMPGLGQHVGVEVSAGEWLESVMDKLKNPAKGGKQKLPKKLSAVLRPYQEEGFQWLCFLSQLGFGGCLADDMGLGKTVQIISFLLARKESGEKKPHLVVVPTSLLENWKNELSRFAPTLSYGVLHASGMSSDEAQDALGGLDLLVTTYGMCNRLPWLSETRFDCIVLDEAQAIKNASTAQARAVKKLQGVRRFVMTGTPVENRLTDLWSLFDFVNPGLLGTSAEFRDYLQKAENHPGGYGRLRQTVSPYILRRMKTDKNIIADLPEKTECRVYADLSKKQAVLYRHLAEKLKYDLLRAKGPAKRGIVLAYIIKFKQLCNHPDQYAGASGYNVDDSGKFMRLAELCEKIHEDREKVLVFTQFTEIMEPVSDVLEGVFGSRGVCLSGDMPVAKRKEAVNRFQNDPSVRSFVLSVRAGGVGLNLTAASQVIHFDRWWNPAVENQATDRAFRIGQDKRVLVHKFITAGTVEEKIDKLIEAKKALAADVTDSAESVTSGLSDREIISLFSYGLK